jgi:hypothetical protein
MGGTAYLPAQILRHVWPYHPNGHLEPLVRRQAHGGGDEGA